MKQNRLANWTVFDGLLVLLLGLFATRILEGIGVAMCSTPSTSTIKLVSAEPVVEMWDSSHFLHGLPTPNFQGACPAQSSNSSSNFRADNLRNDTWYITAWSNAGFSTSPPFICSHDIADCSMSLANQFMSYVRLTLFVTPLKLNNDIESQVNMIYLGMVSNRVPIIPPFGPHHHISK